jgi:hypothetical protein
VTRTCAKWFKRNFRAAMSWLGAGRLSRGTQPGLFGKLLVAASVSHLCHREAGYLAQVFPHVYVDAELTRMLGADNAKRA